MRIFLQFFKMIIFMLTFMLLFMQDLWAFKINLIDSTLDLSKGMTSTTATVINDSDNMIAIEATARVRSFSQNGEENFDKEAESLIIVPSQMIIPPGGEQVLNIRWIAPKDIPTEQAFRLLIEYVSISEDQLQGKQSEEQKAGININYRIAKSFYVTPKNTKANVTLLGGKKSNLEGKEVLLLSFDNIGSKHQVIQGLDVNITTQNGIVPVSITKQELGKPINFLAKEKRDIPILWPAALENQDIQGVELVGLHE